ncbi:MAG: hypothetical protein BM564_00815 [Bacteroidetes bacterium MedPE-SWsnd-G2]|nr:MAG: hypothetical protein BM564_00815 [Bacteroidetes bacterium MedPE-SWsnd-G2]
MIDKQNIQINSHSKIIADSLSRLLNLLVDTVIWLALFLIIITLLDLVLLKYASPFAQYVVTLIIALLVYFGYYIYFEFNYQWTIGKLITQTKVSSTTGFDLTHKQIVIRTLCRLFPLSPVSFLFSKSGFHDKWSETVVIKTYKPL